MFGEVVGFKLGRAKVYWELRDATGALPCSMWADDWRALGLAPLADGVQVVAAGGCDFYPGSRTSSPGFSLRRRRACASPARATCWPSSRSCAGGWRPRGCSSRRRRCRGRRCRAASASSPASTARRATTSWPGLRRRGWAGRIVWAFAPVQDRHAAGAVTRALQDLAACPEVEVIIVARGGGSLADLFAFCDETLCRTVSMLRVPVIASVGHHTDTTLIDDVAAVSCSTPTHAAEAAVPVHCGEARERLHALGARLEAQGRRAVVERARRLARSRARPRPTSSATGCACTSTCARSARAAVARRSSRRDRDVFTRATVLQRKADATAAAVARGGGLERLRMALAAHEPQRTLERGYALVEGPDGEPVASADAARSLDRMTVRLHDGERRCPSRLRSADLRDGDRADRGDHPPAGLRRGGAARDARPLPRGPRRWSSTAPRSSRRSARARGAAARRARHPPRGRPRRLVTIAL